MSAQGQTNELIRQAVEDAVTAVRAEAAEAVASLEARLAALEDRLSPPSTRAKAAPPVDLPAADMPEPLPEVVEDGPEPVRRPRTPRKTTGS